MSSDVSRELAEALQRMDSLLEKMFAATWGKNFSLPTQEINEAFSQSRKALGVARKLGLLEQPRNKPCSKCGSRMQVSYGEPDDKDIAPPYWWCRHCGHEEDKR